MSATSDTSPASVDVVLIGGGIMSATLGTVLRELDPSPSIVMPGLVGLPASVTGTPA